MAVPKKVLLYKKKYIRRNIWKKREYFAAIKAFSLAKSVFVKNLKSFFCDKQVKKME